MAELSTSESTMMRHRSWDIVILEISLVTPGSIPTAKDVDLLRWLILVLEATLTNAFWVVKQKMSGEFYSLESNRCVPGISTMCPMMDSVPTVLSKKVSMFSSLHKN